MKYLTALVVACNFLFAQANQKAYIYGNIIDAETLEPIPYANIFISNSSIGTASDKDGFFALLDLPPGRYEIIASVIGYELLKANVRILQNSKRNFRFEMYKHPIEMDEVVVRGKTSRKRRRQLDHFRKNFLGTSKNGKNSYIKNEEVIQFERVGSLLLAYANEPLEIINNGLGYKIYYVLDEYQQTPREIKFVGYPYFFEQIPASYQDSVDWVDNRKITYLGSLRHFLTTICKNFEVTEGDTSDRISVLDVEDIKGFRVKATYGDTTFIEEEGFYVLRLYYPLGEDKVGQRTLTNVNKYLSKSKNDNELNLHFPDYLEVKYDYKYYSTENNEEKNILASWITMTCDTTTLDKQGRYFDKYAIKTEGLWSWARVADMLPFDYDINKYRSLNEMP